MAYICSLYFILSFFSWFITVYHWISWGFMVYHVFFRDLSWVIMVYQSLSWFIMVFRDFSWFIMVHFVFSWFIMFYHGLSWFITWVIMVYQSLSCFSWCIMVVSMVYHGFSYFIILYHNLSYSQSNNHCWVIPNFQTHPYYRLDLMEISCGPDKKQDLNAIKSHKNSKVPFNLITKCHKQKLFSASLRNFCCRKSHLWAFPRWSIYHCKVVAENVKRTLKDMEKTDGTFKERFLFGVFLRGC